MDSSSLSATGGGSGDAKSRIMKQIRDEATLANARQLIEKINEHCFERCMPKPGAATSRAEGACITACMEKYIAAWNTVSRQYVVRIQKESSAGAGFVGGGGGGL